MTSERSSVFVNGEKYGCNSALCKISYNVLCGSNSFELWIARGIRAPSFRRLSGKISQLSMLNLQHARRTKSVQSAAVENQRGVEDLRWNAAVLSAADSSIRRADVIAEASLSSRIGGIGGLEKNNAGTLANPIA